jgi:hypothetical protein
MTSSESEGQVPSRKRSRTNNSAEDGAKKARGRPRVDTQDATAADVSCFIVPGVLGDVETYHMSVLWE